MQTTYAVTLFAFLLAVGGSYGVARLIQPIMESRCPGAFLVGWNSTGAVITTFAALAVFWFTVAIVVCGLVSQIMVGQERAGEMSSVLAVPFQGGARKFAAAALIASSVAFAFSALDEHCVAPGGIINQTAPWSGPRLYRWSDVSEISVRCSTVGSGAKLDERSVLFDLGLRGGSHINLGGGTASAGLSDHFYRLIEFAHAHNVKIDRASLGDDCAPPGFEALMRGP